MPTTSKPRDRSATIPTTVLTSHAAERVTADARITAVARSRRFHWFDPDDATETVIVAVQLAMISGTADRSNQNIAGMSVQFTMSADGFLLAQTVRSENDGAGSCNSSNRTVFLLRTPWPESSPVSEEWRIRQDSCNRGV